MVNQGRKTSPPLLPSPILCRKRLLQKLEEALIPLPHHQSTVCKLVLLRAAAGYGKTTLLADFAQRNQISAGWYFLDRADVQFPLFLETLTDIFSQTFPSIKQGLPSSCLQDVVNALQSGDQRFYENALNTYINILDQCISQPFILCLCNYQEVNEEEAIQVFLNYLLQNMPSRLSLVIESRAVPSLELSPLLAYRQLLGLGSNVLGFSSQEIQEYGLLQHGFSMPAEEAEHLATAFDGWIAGMLLATSLGTLVSSSAPDFSSTSWNSSAFFMNQHALLSYIKNDVFALEGQAFTFLQETSLFARLSALKCNHLLQIEHAEALLTHIERQGLFLTRVSSQGDSPTYVLHPVLRQLLSEDLQYRHPEQAIYLHRRAAELFHSWGEDEQAIIHAIAAQEYTLAIDILEKITLPESEGLEQQAAIAHWFDQLPTSVREQRPRLLLIRARLYLEQQEYLQAVPLLEKASELVEHYSSGSDEDTLSTLRAEILIASSVVVFQEGKYTQVQHMCSEALEYLSVDQTEMRIPAFLRLGMCKALTGDYAEGLVYLHQALQLSGHASVTRQTAYIHSSLANTYSLMSNYALSEHHRARAIALYERLNDTRGLINNLTWMAILKRNRGALQEAETMLHDIIARVRNADFQHGEAYALFNLGAHYIDINILPQALISLEESLHLARQISNSRLTDQCLCELAMAYLLLDDSSTAQLLLAQTTVASTRQAGYESLEYELVCSTVLLYQKDFVNASSGFRAYEPLAQKAQSRRSQIECLIRLAICQYQLGNLEEMEEAMEKVVQIVTQGHFEHVPLIELRRFPDVWQAVKKCSDKACLSTWRDMSQKKEEDQDTQEQKNIVERQRPDLEFSPGAGLSIQAFGEPRVIINGTVTRWRMARSLEMCFFLLEHQRPIRKEQLVEALWSEEEEYVDQTVRSALYHLRKTLGAPCIVSQGGLYTLDLSILYGDDIWYDVQLFQNAHAQAQEALEMKQDEQAEKHLRIMIDLYRGDYVQSFYRNWCIFRRDELRQQYIDARRELARLTWKQEQFEECVIHWQHILAIDPCSEEAHYGLMRCYVRLGKRSLAVRQYQRCTEILQRELALSPGPAVQRLYQRLANEH